MKIFIAAVTIVILALLGLGYINTTLQPAPIATTQPTQKPVPAPKPEIASITTDALRIDLTANSTHLSSRQRKEILDAIAATSNLYSVSPLILYSIASVESSFRAWITHNQVEIQGKKDNAIGLTGILYTWWGDQLKDSNIIETKTDLYNPQINILACGYVFNELRKLPLLKGTTTRTESALRRYFGGNYKSYSDKIHAKIGSIIFKKVYK